MCCLQCKLWSKDVCITANHAASLHGLHSAFQGEQIIFIIHLSNSVLCHFVKRKPEAGVKPRDGKTDDSTVAMEHAAPRNLTICPQGEKVNASIRKAFR